MDNNYRRVVIRVEEYPLNYPTSPATLLQFAATRLALNLCDIKRLQNPQPQFDLEAVLGVTLPPSIKIIIYKRVESVNKKLSKLYFHFSRSHSELEKRYLKKHATYFNSVRYGPDGNISFELTAKKVLLSDKVNQLQKYITACVFCFEDDVRRIQPTVSDRVRSAVENTFVLNSGVNHLLVKYWNMPIGDIRSALARLLCSELIRFLKNRCNYWSAFKCILNEMNPTEQYEAISNVVSGRNAKHLLPKLNRVQSDYVSQHHSGDIITELLLWKEKYVDFVFKIWHHSKELIKGEQFLRLLHTSCSKSYKCIDRSVCDKLAYVRRVLYEIWISASNSLKEEILNSNFAAEILSEFEEHDRAHKFECYDHDMKFFLQFFKDMPFEKRNILWLRYWRVFVYRYRAENLSSFLNLCLKHEEIASFGTSVMLDEEIFEGFFNFLFERGLDENVIDYLKICSLKPNFNLFRNMLVKIIRTSRKWLVDPEFDKFLELSQFIDYCSNNKDIDEIKELVFFTQEFQNVLISRLGRGEVDDLIYITKLFVHSEPNLTYAKQSLFEHWIKHYLTSRAIDFNRCENFLIWCDSDSLYLGSNFDFPTNKVFDALLDNAVSKLCILWGPAELNRSEPEPIMIGHLDEFDVVDEFLTWYFRTPALMRDYKLNIIWFQDSPVLRKILCMKNESVINDVLRWFFEGDLDEIRRFKSGFTLKSEVDCAEVGEMSEYFRSMCCSSGCTEL